MNKKFLILLFCLITAILLISYTLFPLAISFTSGVTAHPGDTVEFKIILTAWWTETDVKLSLLSVPEGFTYSFSTNPVHVISRDTNPLWRTETKLFVTIDEKVKDGVYQMLFVWDDQTNDPQRQICGSQPIKITVISEDATEWPTMTISITETTTFTTIYRTETTTTIRRTYTFSTTETTGYVTRTTYIITTSTLVIPKDPLSKFIMEYFPLFLSLIVGTIILILILIYYKKT